MKLKTKLRKVDDSLLYKTYDLTVGEKSIQTPFKAGRKTMPAGEISEISKTYTIDRLDKAEKDNSEEKRLNSAIKSEYSDAINLCFTDCETKNIKRKHIETIADLSYPYSDVLVTPLWTTTIKESKTKGEQVKDEFINLTNDYIEIVESLNNKSILGLIPAKAPRQFLDDILKNYNDHGILNYAINFDGQSVESNLSWFRKLNRILNDYGIQDKALIYSINSGEGRFYKKAESIGAKDFIGLGYGIDIIGLNHTRPKMPTEAWAKLKEQRSEMKFRKFDRNTYGYQRITQTELTRTFSNTAGLKQHNIKEQYKEATSIKDKLIGNSTIEPYIKTKKEVSDKTIKNIKSIRKESFRK